MITGTAVVGVFTNNYSDNILLKIRPMRWLLFLSRLSFICCVCFFIAFTIQLSNWIKNEDAISLMVLIAYVMGFLINPITIICYLIVFIRSRAKLKLIPSWLLTANIIFFVLQVFYFIFFQNDTRHS